MFPRFFSDQSIDTGFLLIRFPVAPPCSIKKKLRWDSTNRFDQACVNFTDPCRIRHNWLSELLVNYNYSAFSSELFFVNESSFVSHMQWHWVLQILWDILRHLETEGQVVPWGHIEVVTFQHIVCEARPQHHRMAFLNASESHLWKSGLGDLNAGTWRGLYHGNWFNIGFLIELQQIYIYIHIYIHIYIYALVLATMDKWTSGQVDKWTSGQAQAWYTLR